MIDSCNLYILFDPSGVSCIEMKVRYLGSAAILVEDSGSTVLCDPWLVDGAYYGSWCHYPPRPFEPEDFNDVDYIYISHIHPDHFHPPTLQRINSDIPVVIHDYTNDYLKSGIEDLGFDVIELTHDERVHLTGDLHINVLAADACDPELCGNYFGCNWYGGAEPSNQSAQVDTMAAIDNGTETIVNMNDCPYPMAERSMRQIKGTYGDIDLVCHQYSAAQFYPQSMVDYTHEEKRLAREKVILEKYMLAEEFLELFDPEYYMPFAGEYVLAGNLSHLNQYTANPPRYQAYEYFVTNIDPDEHRCVFLNANEHLDIETGTVSKPFEPVDPLDRRRYIEEELASRTFTYEHDPMPGLSELEPDIGRAYEHLETKRETLEFETDTTVLISLPDDHYAEVTMDGNGYDVIGSADLGAYDGYVKFDLDPRLLNRILEGPEHAHWADAKIGSHLGISKQPDIYERGLYEAMAAFHT